MRVHADYEIGEERHAVIVVDAVNVVAVGASRGLAVRLRVDRCAEPRPAVHKAVARRVRQLRRVRRIRQIAEIEALIVAEVPVRGVLARLDINRPRVVRPARQTLCPAVLDHLRHGIAPGGEVGERVPALQVGDCHRLARIELVVGVRVQEDGPAVQGGLARVLDPVVVQVLPLQAGDRARGG